MNESIGAKLKQAREQHRLTIQQVSETTKVRTHYLQALENDDLSAISSAAQARGFLRIYAEFLGLNIADLMLIKSPTEPTPTPQPSTSSHDHSLAAAQDTASNNKPERPGLWGNLLNRFTRRAEKETVTLQTTETASLVEIPLTPEPQSFIPARVTDDLPAVLDSTIGGSTSELIAVGTETAPAKESTAKIKISKKTGSRPRKSSTRIEKQNNIKKKINV